MDEWTGRVRVSRVLELQDRPEARIFADRELAADPEARKAELVEEYTERFANPYNAAERGFVDDVIDPAETRAKVIAGFELLRTKREELPKRKHGNSPL